MTNEHLKTEATALLTRLGDAGHKDVVRIEFSGCGDSGGIDYVEGLEESHALYKEIRDWAEEFAHELPNWWDNDGGSGWIELDVQAQQIRYSVDQHYTGSETVQAGAIGSDGTETPLDPEE